MTLKNTWEDIGTNLLGPALCLYIHETIARADQRKLDCMYFLARDGFLPYQIYKILQPLHQGRKPAHGYLQISRAVSLPASISRLGAREIDFCLHTRGHCSLIEMLQTLRLASGPIVAQIVAAGIDVSASIADPWNNVTLHTLLENDSFQRSIGEETDAKRNRLIAYLRSVGFFQNKRVGFADLGWQHGIQNDFARILTDVANGPQIWGMYWSLFSVDESDRANPELKLGIFYDFRRKQSLTELAPLYFRSFFERLVRGPDAEVVDYTGESVSVVPIYNERGTTWEAETAHFDYVQILQNTVCNFANDYVRKLITKTTSDRNQEIIELKKQIERFIFFPSRKQIEAFRFFSPDLVPSANFSKLFHFKKWKAQFQQSLWKSSYLAATAGNLMCWVFHEKERLNLYRKSLHETRYPRSF